MKNSNRIIDFDTLFSKKSHVSEPSISLSARESDFPSPEAEAVSQYAKKNRYCISSLEIKSLLLNYQSDDGFLSSRWSPNLLHPEGRLADSSWLRLQVLPGLIKDRLRYHSNFSVIELDNQFGFKGSERLTPKT